MLFTRYSEIAKNKWQLVQRALANNDTVLDYTPIYTKKRKYSSTCLKGASGCFHWELSIGIAPTAISIVMAIFAHIQQKKE